MHAAASHGRQASPWRKQSKGAPACCGRRLRSARATVARRRQQPGAAEQARLPLSLCLRHSQVVEARLAARSAAAQPAAAVWSLFAAAPARRRKALRRERNEAVRVSVTRQRAARQRARTTPAPRHAQNSRAVAGERRVALGGTHQRARAVVCSHLARGRSSVRAACRSAPREALDSGRLHQAAGVVKSWRARRRARRVRERVRGKQSAHAYVHYCRHL